MSLPGMYLALPQHSSLSSIAFGRSSRLHPVSAQSCSRLVLTGRPTLARPCEEVQRSTSLMCSPLLQQHCSVCLFRRVWMVLEMKGRWLYCCSFVGCSFQDFFITTFSILLQLPSSFYSIRFVSVYLVHQYSSIPGKYVFYFGN